MAVIFLGSTEALSSEQTSRILVPILRWLDPQISWDTINRLHLVIRKLGHITEYGILAALFWRALRSLASLQKPILLTLVLCGCAVFAAGDELHQSCVPGRTASGGDVLIDILGAFIGTSICALVACGQPRAA